MIKDVKLWGVGVLVSCLGFVLLTPDRIGEQLWNALKIPVAVLAGGTWIGFVLPIIARNSGPASGGSGGGDVDLAAAAAPDETLIAAARFPAKLFISALTIGWLALAAWDGILRPMHQYIRAGIWAAAAVALGFYLARLLQRRVVISPAAISWTEHGENVSRPYAEVRDFQVLSQREIRVVFSDGRTVAVTSDMADLRKVLATIAARRIV